MEIKNTIFEIRKEIKSWIKQGLSIGLVPTMGFLHEGHGSLIKRSVLENDKTIVSIFVNPMQFSKGEDLGTYPRDFERDKKFCESLGADLIFHPSPEEMYGNGFFSYIDMNIITEGLCGGSRENMFRGVCTVVSKLFNITNPSRAYFGEKDAQQLAVVKQMVKDLNFDLEIVGCPSVREEDGLAKSSRNSYLNEDERAVAPKIYKALQSAKDMVDKGESNSDFVTQQVKELIETEKLFRLDYVDIVDEYTMQPLKLIKNDSKALIMIAVYVGKARLIDNVKLK